MADSKKLKKDDAVPLVSGCAKGIGHGKGVRWLEGPAGFMASAPLPFYANPPKIVSKMEALLSQAKYLAGALHEVNKRINDLEKRDDCGLSGKQ
ncbi:MAG: hypothetical protein V1913_15980 [Fibrobacterota bacterium]